MEKQNIGLIPHYVSPAAFVHYCIVALVPLVGSRPSIGDVVAIGGFATVANYCSQHVLFGALAHRQQRVERDVALVVHPLLPTRAQRPPLNVDYQVLWPCLNA